MSERARRERTRAATPPRTPRSAPQREGAVVSETNRRFAARLDEVAALLEQQGANPFRVRAWRRAAEVLRRLEVPAESIVAREGIGGLRALPAIGETLARAIRDLVESGRLPMLDRLRGEVDPEALLRTVPGVGRALARRLHDELGIGTLEELEAAAHNGRLERMPGIGGKRLAGIRDALAARLQRGRGARPPVAAEPGVAELLDVDREYRERAARGELRLLAPRRFNPRHEAWLPILHASRGGLHYTALFSNTARAHQLGRTHDWVVLYCDGRDGERRFTVVTANDGPLVGRRIVRGRERECENAYRDLSPAPPSVQPFRASLDERSLATSRAGLNPSTTRKAAPKVPSRAKRGSTRARRRAAGAKGG
jgi:putative hydrolase